MNKEVGLSLERLEAKTKEEWAGFSGVLFSLPVYDRETGNETPPGFPADHDRQDWICHLWIDGCDRPLGIGGKTPEDSLVNAYRHALEYMDQEGRRGARG